MEKNKPLLKLRHIHQIYTSGSRRFTAVQDVNLTVYEGEFIALLGPSGCGKSTLLRIITGLQKPSEGTVLYRDQPVEGVNPYASIVFQTFALFPWLTVLENVELALKARGVPANIRTPRALDLIDRVGLDGFESAYPRELSGGMRQKVGFARAMAVEPELLCLDEPFSALDVLSAESLRNELMELWTTGKIPTRAILMVSHNIEETVFMADRIVVMDKEPGRILSELTITLPHPRQKKSDEFQTLIDQVYSMLAGQTQPEIVELGSAPGEPGVTRSLPKVTITDLAGFLENLAEMPQNRADIYRLSEELNVDSGHILTLTEAAELLGFATIAKGDITLTPLGETFAEASILARKEIFATRIRRLPLVRWLLSMLSSSDKKALPTGVILTALELEFHKEEAERQLETLINWGRYAEILSYNDDQEILYLETAPDLIPQII
ncbi:MAG: ABC-type nitrate/sulfonate/bicarbonate transport system, ATPase component [Anaerolineae bacterium]|jgi:NitT/TauT family transport system ATP-binding protein|nr:MAG: ABC-type nitrate/sulfonate/bicarbonate transport system, ATPase component [Anaerolineae bacterium]